MSKIYYNPCHICQLRDTCQTDFRKRVYESCNQFVKIIYQEHDISIAKRFFDGIKSEPNRNRSERFTIHVKTSTMEWLGNYHILRVIGHVKTSDNHSEYINAILWDMNKLEIWNLHDTIISAVLTYKQPKYKMDKYGLSIYGVNILVLEWGRNNKKK